MKNITETQIGLDRKPVTTYIAEALTNVGRGQDKLNALFTRIQSGSVFAQNMQRLMTYASGKGLESVENRSSGAYFLNENEIGSSQNAKDALKALRTSGASGFSQFRDLEAKLKLGPGVGFVLPPKCYFDLLDMGQRNPDYALNYNAPGGTELARQGISNVIGASIDPDNTSPIGPEGCFQMSGATEGLQVAIQAVKATGGEKGRVAIFGPGYYAAPLAADRIGLDPYRISSLFMNPNTGFLPTLEDIKTQIKDETRLLVVSAPNNPDGSDYSADDWERILGYMKTQPGTKLLLDNIFGDLRFDRSTQDLCLTTAKELGMLDQIIVTGSMSKGMNLPGPRIGWLATTNPQMQSAIDEILVDRRCNPPLTQTPLLEFEGLASRVEAIMQNDRRIQSPEDALNSVGLKPISFGKADFGKMFTERQSWKSSTLGYYKGNLETATAILARSGVMVENSADLAGFNTFVRINVPPGTNSMDFLAQLMLTTATYTQVSPCFGIPQSEWDQNRGLWLRISYACDRDDLIEGVLRLAAFNRYYNERPSNPNKLPISYDQQI